MVELLHLSGAPDYQLRVACRDTAELDALLRILRDRLGAADTETTIVLRSGPPLCSLTSAAWGTVRDRARSRKGDPGSNR